MKITKKQYYENIILKKENEELKKKLHFFNKKYPCIKNTGKKLKKEERQILRKFNLLHKRKLCYGLFDPTNKKYKMCKIICDPQISLICKRVSVLITDRSEIV